MLPPPEAFTVGWVASMSLELTAAKAMLEDCETVHMLKDDTSYHIGRIGHHWVAMPVCPRIGTNPAAIVLNNMLRSFRNVRHVLVVGIGGGVPGYGPSLQHQIALGDVVVGYPEDREGGVVNYGFGAWENDRSLTHSGHTLHPSAALLDAVCNIRSEHMFTPGGRIPRLLDLLQQTLPDFKDPGPGFDHLFPDDYPRPDSDELCEGPCEFSRPKTREDRGCGATRGYNVPEIHYGTIGSADELVASSARRNELYKKLDIICFERTAAGIVGNQQALVIRGICDYADSHRNKKWQKYAAGTAAAYAKEVLLSLAPPRLVTKALQPPQDPVSACLRSLAYPEMESRSHDIDGAAEGTCEWLLTHDVYRRWAAAHRGMLWIKGKPGSGKSTLLKYALANRTVGEAEIVLSFFFHGGGDELQKTPLGFFRSLTHQLLQQAPDALTDVVDMFERKSREVGSPGKDWKWHQEELRGFLALTLAKVIERRPIRLFIDALDECGRKSAIYISRWLKSLLSKHPQSGSQCHICVTCRHYPLLDRDCEFEVCAERENTQDISTYVEARLSESAELASSRIPDLITNRASGLFMWARLVVSRVLELDGEGKPLGVIEREIYSIAEDMGELYRHLICGMGPASLKLIQWICFAIRPLTLDELRWAMALEFDPPADSLQTCQNSPDYIPDNGRMARQVLALSHGLAEISYGDLERGAPTVQFIHQSAKDFFVRDGLLLLDSSQTSAASAISTAHCRLSWICMDYVGLVLLEGAKTHEDSAFPFLQYALTSWAKDARGSDDCSVLRRQLELHCRTRDVLTALWFGITWAITNGGLLSLKTQMDGT